MRRVLALTGTVALATGGWLLLGGGDDASAAPVDAVFEYSGAEEPFVVPAEVCEVTVLAIGAAGGDGSIADLPDDLAPAGLSIGSGTGALGGSTTATFAVTPGEILDVVVGGAGGEGQQPPSVQPPAETRADSPTPTGLLDNGGEPGFNGGGTGGDGVNAGGGGGGASEVFRGESAVVVAGGGGGGGGFNAGGDGGAGGGPGEDGGDGSMNEPPNGDVTPQGNGTPAQGGGSGGNGGGGGAAATGPGGGTDGGDGSPGTGGDGAEGLDAGGAGGGGAQGGGGGGSNDTGEGFAGGGGGGAGSSSGPEGAVFDSAVEGDAEGNGLIVITYDPAAGTCGPLAVVVEPRFTG